MCLKYKLLQSDSNVNLKKTENKNYAVYLFLTEHQQHLRWQEKGGYGHFMTGLNVQI